jgi:hypothetical protein|tara:strand:- start:73 stop:372 length:300 start_codon:yes stop_codon:yes gene_type:complete
VVFRQWSKSKLVEMPEFMVWRYSEQPKMKRALRGYVRLLPRNWESQVFFVAQMVWAKTHNEPRALNLLEDKRASPRVGSCPRRNTKEILERMVLGKRLG